MSWGRVALAIAGPFVWMDKFQNYFITAPVIDVYWRNWLAENVAGAAQTPPFLTDIRLEVKHYPRTIEMKFGSQKDDFDQMWGLSVQK